MTSPSEEQKQWQRDWTIIRNTFLHPRTPKPFVFVNTDDYWVWVCPDCGQAGTPTFNQWDATSRARAHCTSNRHIHPKDQETLDLLKVLAKPNGLCADHELETKQRILEGAAK